MPIRKKSEIENTEEKEVKSFENGDMKHCPYCDNKIKAKAVKCQYCGEFLDKKHTNSSIIKSNDYANSQEGGALINGRSFKSIFKCEGRMNRGEYWFYSLAGYVAYFGLCMLMGFIIGILNDGYISDGTSTGIAYGLIVPVFIWFAMIGICRLHDLGKKWPLIILWFIPLINLIIGIMLGFSKGDEGKNEFGDEPNSVSKTINIISVIMGILVVIFMVWAES